MALNLKEHMFLLLLVGFSNFQWTFLFNKRLSKNMSDFIRSLEILGTLMIIGKITVALNL